MISLPLARPACAHAAETGRMQTIIALSDDKPGAGLSLLLSRVRAAQVRRLHFS